MAFDRHKVVPAPAELEHEPNLYVYLESCLSTGRHSHASMGEVREPRLFVSPEIGYSYVAAVAPLE